MTSRSLGRFTAQPNRTCAALRDRGNKQLRDTFSPHGGNPGGNPILLIGGGLWPRVGIYPYPSQVFFAFLNFHGGFSNIVPRYDSSRSRTAFRVAGAGRGREILLNEVERSIFRCNQSEFQPRFSDGRRLRLSSWLFAVPVFGT